MWLLPARVAGDRTVRLFLTERAAQRISAALLIEDAERRSERWQDLLSTEPPLLLWALGSASEFRDAPPESLVQVARWCDRHGLDDLARLERAPREFDSTRPRAWFAKARDGGDVPRRWETRQAASAWCASRIEDATAWVFGADGASELTPAWLACALQELCRSPQSPSFDPQSPESASTAKASLASVQASGEANDALVESSARPWVVKAREPEVPDDSVELLGPLARHLLRLRSLSEEFDRQLLAAKLASLKELAYGASHEINNPLANIATRAQALLADERDAERRRKLATIAAQAYRAHEMISDLMLFARPPALRPEPIDVAALVDKVLSEFAEQARTQGVTLTRIGGASTDLTGLVDPTQLAVAVQALVRNAFESLEGPGRVEVEVQRVAAGSRSANPSRLRITVRDDGPGVAPRAAPHLFDPFFSGREAGRGLGFGLAKCWRIVTAHGGQVRHEETAARGATFVIELPCVD